MFHVWISRSDEFPGLHYVDGPFDTEEGAWAYVGEKLPPLTEVDESGIEVAMYTVLNPDQPHQWED